MLFFERDARAGSRIVFGLEALRWIDVRRREHRPFSENADSRLGQERLVGVDRRVLLGLALRLGEAAPLNGIRVEDVGGRSEKSRPFLERQRSEQAAVMCERLEQLGCRPQLRRGLL